MPHTAVGGKSAEPPDVKSGKQKASVVQAYVISTKCVAGGGGVGGGRLSFPPPPGPSVCWHPWTLPSSAPHTHSLRSVFKSTYTHSLALLPHRRSRPPDRPRTHFPPPPPVPSVRPPHRRQGRRRGQGRRPGHRGNQCQGQGRLGSRGSLPGPRHPRRPQDQPAAVEVRGQEGTPRARHGPGPRTGRGGRGGRRGRGRRRVARPVADVVPIAKRGR